jgi:hypothetical protein
LNNGLQLLENWKAKVKNKEQVAVTAASEATTPNKGQPCEHIDLQPMVDCLEEKVGVAEHLINALQVKLDEGLSDVPSNSEVSALKGMLATVSERNNKLEDDFTICL